MLSHWIFMTNLIIISAFLHEIIEVQYHSQDHTAIKRQCWVIRPILLLYCFSSFLELPGSGLAQVGSWLPEVLWSPIDLIETVELFQNQKCNTYTALVGAGLHPLDWVQWWQEGILYRDFRGFLCLCPRQINVKIHAFLVVFSRQSIFIIGNVLYIHINSC